MATQARRVVAGRLRPRCRFGVVLADDVGLVLAAEALGRRSEYFQTVKRLWSRARHHWFDVLLVAGIGTSIAGAVVAQGRLHGPEGPMWLDIILAPSIVGPLLARRRFPFGAPVGVGAGVVIASFADNSLVPFDPIPFFAGCAGVFLLAQLPHRRQAVAGLAIAVGVEAIVVRNDPRGQIGQFVFVSLIFTIVWVVGFTLGRKFAEADEAKERAARAEREREARARAAVTEERARIARELHDGVGHSVSGMK